jgi:hypothetical protein
MVKGLLHRKRSIEVENLKSRVQVRCVAVREKKIFFSRTFSVEHSLCIRKPDAVVETLPMVAARSNRAIRIVVYLLSLVIYLENRRQG